MTNYWIIEVYSDEKANISVTSEEEIDALKKMDQIEEWQYASTDEASEDEMIERAEDKGLEHDPW